VILRFLPLVWRNLWRNRRRSILTLLGVAVAVFVYAALRSAIDGITFPIREVGASRLLNVREAGRANVLASRLPQSYAEQVAAVDGVAAATGVLNDLAVIGDNRVHVFVRGVDPDSYRQVQPLRVDPAAWQAFREQPDAALVGHRLLPRLGWRVGGGVELPSIDLRLTVVGAIPAQGIDLESHMLVRRDTLQRARGAEGQVTYVLVAPAPDRSPSRVAADIDRAFASAVAPTATASVEAYAQAVVDDFLGFVAYLRVMGLLAVLVTMVAAANAVAMSVRDRTREIGVLKAVGFPPRLVLSMVLAESLLLAAAGGAIGIGAAAIAIGTKGASTAGLVLESSTTVTAALLALLIGAGGGLLPAVGAARLRVVEALRASG
jgi:putative ABC transport system permease protein